jgi:hypothetical protein
LTILTQIGGVIYLISFITHTKINSFTHNKYKASFFKLVSFLILYILATFLLVPIIAKPFDRVPLPFSEKNHLKPLNVLTCFLNRNYIKTDLKQTVINVANNMNKTYPGTTINYLDANFPFIKKFPLFPHLSHNDGGKLDISFCYRDAASGKSTNKCPSFLGYGISEGPSYKEVDTCIYCTQKGYWGYNLLSKIIPQINKEYFIFDKEKTKSLITLFIAEKSIGKIFIEPHLKTRLDLTSDKVRFQGCKSVRHDDHIHIQLK